MKLNFRIQFFFLYILLGSRVFSQELGNPFVQTYQPTDYKAHPQNFAVVQDQNGILYFGNTEGVLEFDGSSWRITKLPNDFTIRDLAVDSLGRIYVSGVSNFGYLSPNPIGKYVFNSLLDSLPEEDKKIRDVWEILIHNSNDVYFRSSQKIFLYKKNKLIKIWNTNHLFSTIFSFDNQVFVIENNVGIYALREDSIKEIVVKPQNYYTYNRFKSQLPSQKGIILGTRTQGLQLFSPIENSKSYEIKQFQTEADNFLKEEDMQGGVKFEGGFLLCTNSGGIVSIDNNGKILRFFSRNEGVTNNTIYEIITDSQQGVWLATAKGVIRIDYPSSLSYWKEENGLKGAVTSIIRYKNRMLFGTMGGLFELKNNQPIRLEQPKGLAIWSLLEWINPDNKSDTNLFLGTSEGIYEFHHEKLTLIFPQPNCYKLILSQQSSNRIYIGSIDGLLIGKIINGKYVHEQLISEVLDIRSITEDVNGNLWLRTFRDGIAFIQFDKNNLKNYQVFKYNKEHGLPSNRNNVPYLLNDKIVFATDTGLYEFDETSKYFKPNSYLGNWHQQNKKNIFHIVIDKVQNLWIAGSNTRLSPIIFARKNSNLGQKNPFEFQFEPFQQIPDMLILSLYLEDNGIFWIGGSDGVFRYDNKHHQSQNPIFQTLIRKISIHHDSTLYEGATPSSNVKSPYIIPYGSPIKIQYSSPYYTNSKTIFYKASLSKKGTKNIYWTSWSEDTYKEYFNLWEGEYIFKVKSLNIFGRESIETTLHFRVQPPYYRSNFAYFIYAVLTICFIFIILKINTLRLEKLNERLQLIVERKTSEVQEKNVLLEHQKEELKSQTEFLKKNNEELIKKGIELEQKTEEIQSQRDSIIEQKKTLEELNDNIKTLSVIGQQITSTLELREIVKKLYLNVNKLMKAEIFGIGILNEKLNRIELSEYIEKGVFLPNTFDDLYDENRLSVKCFKKDKIFVINDIEKEYEKIIGKKPTVRVGEIPSSVIYMPLKIAEKSIGVITVQSFEKSAYTSTDVEILKNLASYVSIALINSKSFQEVNAQKEQLERARQVISLQNKRLKDINLNLEEQVTQRTKELRDAYQELDTFLYRSAHDLKGPVSRLLGLCYVAKLEITEKIAHDYLNRLEESTKNMESMIARLLRLHEVKVHIPNYQIFILSDLIEEILLDISIPSFISLTIYYHSLENLHFKTDKLLFSSVIKRVIENSVQFFDKTKTKHFIQLDFSQSPDEQLIVSIVDNGIGIPHEATTKIFDMFYIGTNQSKGFGLGLYEANIVSKKLKSKIFLVESDNHHTEFAFVIPIDIY